MVADLTPAQLRNLDLLRRADEPIVFDRDAIESLTAEMHDVVEHLSDRLQAAGMADIFLNKTRIAGVLGCEARYVGDDSFEWNVATATGTVAHRAIELGINWRDEPVPAELVDIAIELIIADGRGPAVWLGSASPAECADLRGGATDAVVKFIETFPPIDPRSRPVVESSIRWPVRGPIVFGGKVDLVLGVAAGAESRKVVIDLKTGVTRAEHLDDLRFYALVETLRTGVPPRKVASFYLAAGNAVVEDVTVDLLRSAIRRTVDAAVAAVELAEGRAATTTPGAMCRWCALQAECDTGRAYLADLDDN
ncbi:MAG: PD-(D/E)XK nuclease family protein [Actinomycetota bacterium]|nr:PD-(D/E)XK nuclease family protein [Actinomycetota bacterium]MDA3035015.1 PD-(D/E)XK nuclease family protein [Actinomycetota bacterium]